MAGKIILWAAQGFGVGRIPVAPGTFGSVLGLLWFALLLASHSLAVFALGAIAGIFLSIWLCGAGEKLVGRKDPGCVVMDEVAAMPVCFLSWLALFLAKHAVLPGVGEIIHTHWVLGVVVFAAFRFFDVLKPWPVRQSQSLPGGWGITIDDVLAAVYVNLLVLAVHAVHPLV